MPPVSAHFNGGVNLDDAETVMREIATRVPSGLDRIPDGEPGGRREWIQFQWEKFCETPELEQLGGMGPVGTAYNETPRVRLKPGADSSAISWPNLGYAESYRVTFDIFTKLRSAGVLPAGTRFQVQYPTPLASINGWVLPEDQGALEPSYQEALFADLADFLTGVPHEDIAVQWDVAIEFGLLEQVFEGWEQYPFDAVVRRLVRCLNEVPPDVHAGLHLCYGDRQHRHFKEPETLEMQVRVVNEVVAGASRDLTWMSFTVPQYRRDHEYFEPLAELNVPGTSRLCFGIVPYHADDQVAGTTEAQVELIDIYLRASQVGDHLLHWGICTECGMRRAETVEIPGLLDMHREILATYSH